jgi:hypothetical protein
MIHLWNYFKLDFLNKADGPEYIVGLKCLPRKKNSYLKTCAYGNLFITWKEQLEDVKPSWYSTAKCVMLTIHIHPPPFTCLICMTYTESWGTIPEYIHVVSLSIGLITQVLTALLSLSLETSSPFFLLPRERVSWPFCLGYHYACFWLDPLAS